MREFGKELERARRWRKRAQASALKIAKRLFDMDAENARIRQQIEAMEAGNIPGAMAPYKPEAD